MTKKYFKKNLEDYDGKEIEIIRKCPICEQDLSLSDFVSTNLNKNVEESVWNDIRIAIPCCRCLKILEKLETAHAIQTSYNPQYNLSHLTLFYNSIFEETEIITLVKKEVLKNLKKFGIIE
jgi:hypothetical protein